MSMNKITYHPKDELLSSHANGDLPESLAVAISLHCELCPQCQKKLDAITNRLASKTWDSTGNKEEKEANEKASDSDGFDSMLANIMALEIEPTHLAPEPVYTLFIDDKEYQLPYILHRYDNLKWNHLGAVSRTRLNEEQDTRSNLLHIKPGGEIPHHTHKGFELTLLLDGSFEDESGYYQKGDFIWLDASNSHSPKTSEGCLCYTVQNAPLYFKQGLSKLFNPIGNLLY